MSLANRSLSSAKINLTFQAVIANTLLDGTVVSSGIDGSQVNKLTSGIENDQADRALQYQDILLATGQLQQIDLYNFSNLDIGAGAGNDALGQPISPMENIVGIVIKNENAEGAAGLLEVYAGVTNPWRKIGDHTVANGAALGGGGYILKYQPQAGGLDIANGSSQNIVLKANGGPVTYSIYLIGRHDDEASSSSSSSSSSNSSSSNSSSSSSSSSSHSRSSSSSASSQSSNSSSSSSSSSSHSRSSNSSSSSSSSSSSKSR